VKFDRSLCLNEYVNRVITTAGSGITAMKVNCQHLAKIAAPSIPGPCPCRRIGHFSWKERKTNKSLLEELGEIETRIIEKSEDSTIEILRTYKKIRLLAEIFFFFYLVDGSNVTAKGLPNNFPVPVPVKIKQSLKKRMRP
jgi:hypothetical protein